MKEINWVRVCKCKPRPSFDFSEGFLLSWGVFQKLFLNPFQSSVAFQIENKHFLCSGNKWLVSIWNATLGWYRLSSEFQRVLVKIDHFTLKTFFLNNWKNNEELLRKGFQEPKLFLKVVTEFPELYFCTPCMVQEWNSSIRTKFLNLMTFCDQVQHIKG